VRGRPSRGRKVAKVLLIVGLVLGLLIGGTVLYVNNYINHKIRQTHNPDIVVDPLPAGRAYNILVLGSDRRDVVDPAERQERQFRGGSGRRADTILLIHVPADQRSAVVLSFPRDLRVRIPGRSGFSKINAAYAGGPNLMIQTIKAHTGLEIHHYVEVNFASFQRVVDVVGGVRLCVDRAYNDPQSGLVIPRPGCRLFDGKLALAYVRMRKQDPRGDFGRIERQQQFMRVLMSRVTSIGFLTDIPRLLKLADAVSRGVVTDQSLGLAELRGIANKLAGFKQSNVDFRVVPSDPRYIGGVSYVVEREREARALYEALRTDQPLPPYGKTAISLPTPQDVTVTVLNGTMRAGLADAWARRLRSLGYQVRDVGNADRRDVPTTRIVFTPGAEAKAQLIQGEFPGSTAEPATTPQRTDVVVILGADAAASPSPG
jgi:LCP family protein required for cell wall assembly